MCVGDFGEWGDEGGVDDISVDYEKDDTESDYRCYRKHLGWISVLNFTKPIQYGMFVCLKREK